MYRIVLSLIVCFTFVFARAQNINLTEKSPEIYCTNGIDSFSATWSNVPANSNIVFYQSTDPLFNTYINLGPGACNFQTPSAALMTLLRTGTCNSTNLIPAGPADFVPANALVIVFTGNGTDYPYNFSSLCSTNQPVYILQNACTQG